MMPAVMSLSEAAAITHGALRGSDCLFHGVAIDSRRTRRGDLFVAIPPAAGASGADGHDFIGQASAHGAVGALVSKAAISGVGDVGDAGVAQIKVADTTAALGQLGANWRRRFDRPLVAVTGSNGKTTVSALIAAIFNGGGRCLSPRASFNNQWGVPMTLLRLREHHTHIVIEMGMNQPGEIEALSALARPSVALINNAAPAHLAGLTDLRGIADAKAEIFSGLIPGGTAVLNADDEFYDHWRRRARGAGRVLSFGTRKAAGVVAADISVDPQSSAFELRIGGRGGRGSPRDARRIRVRLPLPGRHNVLNATAAAAAATAVGVELTQIKAGLESCAALDGRLRPLAGLNGALIIDDSYNANPVSAKAALEVLAGFDGGRIAVFGVMAELGAQSDALHREVGRHARRCGIQCLLCLGPKDSGAVAGYMDGFGKKAKCFDAPGPLLAHLVPMLEAGVTVLVKGSRAAAMERVAAELVAEAGAATAMTMPRGGALC